MAIKDHLDRGALSQHRIRSTGDQNPDQGGRGTRRGSDPGSQGRGSSDPCKARWMVPMHYGTFRLSHEPIDEPLQLLDEEARSAGIKDRVFVLEEGVTRFF